MYGNFLEGLRKIAKSSVRIAVVQAQILIGNAQNISQNRTRLKQFPRYEHEEHYFIEDNDDKYNEDNDDDVYPAIYTEIL
jgi:hypothetical protein